MLEPVQPAADPAAGFAGFSTGRGKPIAVSAASLDRARRMVAEAEESFDNAAAAAAAEEPAAAPMARPAANGESQLLLQPRGQPRPLQAQPQPRPAATAATGGFGGFCFAASGSHNR